MGSHVDQCHRRDISHLQANERIAVTVEECIRLDDMVGTHCVVHNGTRELLASSEVHQT
jgi:hypothetical protein